MPQSFICLNCHVVFSTKNHAPFLADDDLVSRLHEYIGGIARESGSKLLAAGGMPDHIHLLVSLGKQNTIADTIRDIKSNSSRWIHDTFKNLRGFGWQTGYGAFAVSFSSMEDVKQYIAGQREHHRVRSFKEEFIALLQRHNIEYDERYIWN